MVTNDLHFWIVSMIGEEGLEINREPYVIVVTLCSSAFPKINLKREATRCRTEIGSPTTGHCMAANAGPTVFVRGAGLRFYNVDKGFDDNPS